jgi:hypothetical protein
VAKDRKKRERALAKAERARSQLPVDGSKLNMGNTYSSAPEFYEDRTFECRDCGGVETWTAAQQKWWYEEAGGYFFATAIRCRACRVVERERVAETREKSGHPPKPAGNPKRH